MVRHRTYSIADAGGIWAFLELKRKEHRGYGPEFLMDCINRDVSISSAAKLIGKSRKRVGFYLDELKKVEPKP